MIRKERGRGTILTGDTIKNYKDHEVEFDGMMRDVRDGVLMTI